MNKICKGLFTSFHNEQFYKIENYDAMEDFFMTITSASDIWNFCWSQGGITAGRIDCDHAVFPYYTADKIADAKSYTGPYTAVKIERNGKTYIWEPFAPLADSPNARAYLSQNITRNIYKNTASTKVFFEEINAELELAFEYGWTSSAKFGLVRIARIRNLSSKAQTVSVLDGCRNILPACVSADFQNGNSVLLDAYKKTDLDTESNIALFAVSSIVTDKAEPSEGLYANTCWFSTEDKLVLSPDAPTDFINGSLLSNDTVIKGKRPACYICKTITLKPHTDSMTDDHSLWYQVFDTSLDACKIALLKRQLQDRATAQAVLEQDIAQGEALMQQYVAAADGIQNTADKTVCAHHFENVMFNIMRGGLFANNGKISVDDFISFVQVKNKSLVGDAKKVLADAYSSSDDKNFLNYESVRKQFQLTNQFQLKRLFFEYIPLTFSRRHGDPSRPWNRFNIKLHDENGNALLNYEGNWRDIFQNWEALAYSYPQYSLNMTSVFLDAMTVDGFNPYHISRSGIDWEIPDPLNPWAQIGYWGDHQVIYLEKLLELCSKTDRKNLLSSLNEKRFTSANVPYRLKSYAEIVKDPRNTIFFDRELSNRLQQEAKTIGSDAKLVRGSDGQPTLISFTAKLLQIIIAKAANFIPGGGIWLNTQRPEWNDANNALAGYGLSMVTLYYLYRYITFLSELYAEVPDSYFTLPGEIADCFLKLGKLYDSFEPQSTATDSTTRRLFSNKAGILFEIERNSLYAHGYMQPEQNVSATEICKTLTSIKKHLANTILINKRSDGLYHAYNTMTIYEETFEIEHLQEMLEGQVAILSSGLLSPDEALSVITSLKQSKMFEPRQYSYMLYPNKELPHFNKKNCIVKDDILPLTDLLSRTGTKILAKDCNNIYHFNPEFRNARLMDVFISSLPEQEMPTSDEKEKLNSLYEKTFNHQSFTGRSGTFYAYEGLGSIYWHMVSKLLLAVQENAISAIQGMQKGTCTEQTAKLLAAAYYDVRKGIGFNKEPSVYGAFPCDPYSHTPSGQGAKQPGMTGQVKEEILTRWGELGVSIDSGTASFSPFLLQQSEFQNDKTLTFTWCSIPITYALSDESCIEITTNTGSKIKRTGTSLTGEESNHIFKRDGLISNVRVHISSLPFGRIDTK